MELIWRPAQPALEPVQALLESRAQSLRDQGFSAPVLLGIETGDPYACLDVVTNAGTYRLVVLAEAAGSGRTDYDAMLFDLADPMNPLLDRTPGPGELEAVIDEMIAAIPISQEFRNQLALETRLRGPAGTDLLAGLLASVEDNDDPALAAARATLASAGSGTGAAARTRPGRFAGLGSLVAAVVSFGLGLLTLSLISAMGNSNLAAVAGLIVAGVVFAVIEPSVRQIVTMVRLGLAVRSVASPAAGPLTPPSPTEKS